jgi:hypothetical protein
MPEKDNFSSRTKKESLNLTSFYDLSKKSHASFFWNRASPFYKNSRTIFSFFVKKYKVRDCKTLFRIAPMEILDFYDSARQKRRRGHSCSSLHSNQTNLSRRPVGRSEIHRNLW